MSYTFEWIVPDHILKVGFPDNSSDATAQEFDDAICAYLDAATQPVHLIVDLRHIQVRPSIQRTGQNHLKHPRLGRLVTIGMVGNPIIRFMAGVIAQTLGFRAKDVTSEEEALAYLATVDKNA